jgi:cysteinyl-tRNA synthetase
MEHKLYVYNTLHRKKEEFVPITPGRVGMYVCGPTVYGDGHLGHARPAITFDILFRYLQHLGYKVRYVRNITDVGHLEHDADDGEDKIAKKARLEQKEPMEVVQYYLNRYHKAMDALGVLPPSIEPHASGHIIEQIAYVQKILDAGYAYVSDGSVYFDVLKYAKKYNYGCLSGRNVEELLETTRDLDGQQEKRNACDFALWKKAQPEHIMRWPSPWSDGFPGWHLECSTMGEKYLGEEFDIHGGGLDLLFPHHECEIAQSVAAQGHPCVHYWMHNNMITIDGKKMGKSYGNFITLDEFFTGTHPKLTQPYSPMTIRFFILMAHYRSTVDFSNEALQGAEKGMKRLMEGYNSIARVKATAADTRTAATRAKIDAEEQAMYEALDDDLNTPIVISHLFELVGLINKLIDGSEVIDAAGIEQLTAVMKTFIFDLLGLRDESGAAASDAHAEAFGGAVDLLLALRAKAKADKDWATSDMIRNRLSELGFTVKDTKDGATWSL